MLIPLVLGGEILNVRQYHIINYVFDSLCVGQWKITGYGGRPVGSGLHTWWVVIKYQWYLDGEILKVCYTILLTIFNSLWVKLVKDSRHGESKVAIASYVYGFLAER